MVKKFSGRYWNQKIITTFTKARHRPMFWSRWHQWSTPPRTSVPNTVSHHVSAQTLRRLHWHLPTPSAPHLQPNNRKQNLIQGAQLCQAKVSFPCYVRPIPTELCVPIICMQRLRWSRGSVLAVSTQIRGFKPGRSRRIFRAKKIVSTPSFGGEVKPSVPCRRFAACKISLNLRGSWNLGKITGQFLAHSSTFRC